MIGLKSILLATISKQYTHMYIILMPLSKIWNLVFKMWYLVCLSCSITCRVLHNSIQYVPVFWNDFIYCLFSSSVNHQTLHKRSLKCHICLITLAHPVKYKTDILGHLDFCSIHLISMKEIVSLQQFLTIYLPEKSVK